MPAAVALIIVRPEAFLSLWRSFFTPKENSLWRKPAYAVYQEFDQMVNIELKPVWLWLTGIYSGLTGEGGAQML